MMGVARRRALPRSGPDGGDGPARRFAWLVPLTALAVLALSALEAPAAAPAWVRWLQPDWALAVLFCWSLTMPGRTTMVAAWLFGSLFDALFGDPLGLHGVGFAATVYVASSHGERLLAYPVYQQAAFVFVVVAVVAVFKAVVRAVAGIADLTPLALVPALTTTLVYPAVAACLRSPAERFDP